MNEIEKQIAEEIRAAISALNEALAKAQESGLKVEVTSIRSDLIGREYPREIYSAEISKLTFKTRV